MATRLGKARSTFPFAAQRQRQSAKAAIQCNLKSDRPKWSPSRLKWIGTDANVCMSMTDQLARGRKWRILRRATQARLRVMGQTSTM
jgi:hypothetical protein